MDARNQLLLSAVLDFTQDDLAANRAGRLSARQAARLRRIRSWSRIAIVGVLVLAVGLVVVDVVVVLGPQLSSARQQGASYAVPVVIGALALVVLLVGQSVLRTSRAMHAMVAGAVSSVDGLASTRVRRMRGNIGDPQAGISGRPGGPTCELTIGRIRFFVSPAVLAAFNDGQSYRGYYVGRGFRATLVSAESL